MQIEAFCKQPSKQKSVVMRLHCAGTKNSRKKGFSYFLCCGLGHQEDAGPYQERTTKPHRSTQLPSSVVHGTHPNPAPRNSASGRPSPPSYDQPNVNVSDSRKRFEEASAAHKDRPPISFPRPGETRLSSNGPRKSSTFARENEMRETWGKNKGSARNPYDERSLENSTNFVSIFGNAPLYQIYDANESRRFRNRLRASIRSLRKKRVDNRPPRHIVRTLPSSGVGDDTASSGGSSSDEVTDTKTPSTMPPPTPTFTLINRNGGAKSPDFARNVRVGEMNDMAKEFAGTGPSRTRWAQMPDVTRLKLAEGMTGQQQNLQEARFEIITSEASYYKSLTVLINLFYKAPVFNPNAPASVITDFDKHQLFSNILSIHMASENLLSSLEANFRQDPMMENICDILYEHSEEKLSCYVTYVKNQMYQTRTLSKLMNRPAFSEAVRNIQSMPQCSSLDMNSFLVLPMQRVMRLRLLVGAVLHYTPKSAGAYEDGLVALASLEKLISECNSQKGHMEQKERMVTLSTQLEYKETLRAIGTGDRELVKEGNLRLLETPRQQNPGFRRKISDVVKNKPVQITLFLFDDVLLIAKRKGEKYLVEDISPKGDLAVTIEPIPDGSEIKRTELKTKGDPNDSSFIRPNIQPSRAVSVRQSREITTTRESSRSRSRAGSGRHFSSTTAHEAPPIVGFNFILTFQSTDYSFVDYHFMCDTLEQRERWVDVLQPGYYSVPSEISYDTWDCPQVIAISSYSSTEGDELDLKEGDLMNVIVELSDDWLKGVLPDGREGWVPKNVCQHVEDPQERRKNMKNFLLSEEAQRAYAKRKATGGPMFARVHDVRDTSI